MKWVAALLSLAIVIVIDACPSVAQSVAQPAPQPQSGGDVAKLLVLAPQANGCTPGTSDSFIAGKVQVLANNSNATFDNNFGGYGSRYLGPTPAGLPPENESRLLKRAFELAPRWLQFHLCNQVNFVFIDPNPDPAGNREFGWAFWESSALARSQNGKNHSLARFIGISRAALEDTNLSLGQSEANVVRSLLKNPALSAIHVTVAVTKEDNSVIREDENEAKDPDRAAWAVLAILAHEMGHMFWHDVCDGNSNQYDQSRCFPHFHKYGWPGVQGGAIVSGHWTLRTFGRPIPGAKPLGGEIVPPQQSARTSPEALRRSQDALRRLYTGSGRIRFADLFSTVAPDEDIAETYKLLALTDTIDPNRPRVTSLIVRGDAWSGDIVANLSRQDLCAKVQFIRTTLLEPSLPCSP